MAEGGESVSQNTTEDLSEKIEELQKKTVIDVNLIKDKLSNVCREITATNCKLTDGARMEVLNETGKASAEIFKNAKDVQEFVSNSQESRPENFMRQISGRKQPSQRDSGIGRSVDSSVLQEEMSIVINPVEDREECKYPVQDTSGPNE